MVVAIEKMAQVLAVSPAELQARSLRAFVERERRLTEMDIADLQDRYSVSSSTELAAKIKQHQVHSHPAWEEMIEWERLEAYLAQLDAWRAELENVDV